ncbi:hypothetical protein IFT48_04160 [Pseudomonas fluorescens]|uniref:hypothetical protein n=1 Tax=Pseudomonas fluorescens TaxID=294 RepID=UPI001930B086|nr:hypothetical protein [Pseudomonas fluorescens]MBD8089166.1 hypothetical protein [Pseudomonas fluorescens]
MTDAHKQVDALTGNVPSIFGLSVDQKFALVPGNMKSAMGAIGTKKDIYRVDLRRTIVIEGLNPRVKDARYWEGIEALKESIKTHGWYPDKPLAGYIANINGENVCVIVEGGRRRDAGLLLLQEMTPEMADLYKVPVAPKGAGTSELELQYGLAQGNNNEQFRPYELAILVKRLATVYMQEDNQILKGLTGLVSASYLPKLKMVAGAPEEIATLVLSEEMSVTEAFNLMVKHGDKAVQVLQQAKAAADAAGSKKILGKHMPGRKMENLLKKESRSLYDAALLVKKDPGFAELSEETRAVLEDLMRELQEKETEYKAKEVPNGADDDALEGEFTRADNDAPALTQQIA